MTGRKSTAVQQAGGFALILFAAVAAYFPALQGGMLWDDSSHVTRPDLRTVEGLWRIWTVPGATQQYYPLLHSAFWAEHFLWGDAVLWYHLLNVALHAISAFLVVKIVKELKLPGAWLAGWLFALHPLCAESVAWISEQKSTLSAVFYLAAALCYLKFDESRKRIAYVAALGLFAAALLTKTVTATLPAILLAIAWWRHGRVEWKRDARPLIPWFPMGAAAGLFTAWVERTLIGASGAEFSLTPLQRVLLAGRALWFYAGRVVWPENLTFFYPRWNIDPADWRQYLFPLGAAAAAFWFWRLRGRSRAPLAGFLVFALTLFPALGFFNVYPFRYSYVADHFAYLAMLGILVPAASALAIAGGKYRAGRWAGGALLAALGLLTWRQAGTYRNEETLYRATLERNPGAWLAHNNLGNLLLNDPQRHAEAIAQFQDAIRLQPDFWEAHLSLGNALMETPGRLSDAIAEYRAAAQMAPGSERAQTNLGNALLQTGRVDEAIAHLQSALRIDPGNAEAHNDFGNALSGIPGHLTDATEQYRMALRARPDFPEAHNNLGRALAQSGKLYDAIAEFETAIRLRPDYWSAHNNLGNALSQLPGRLNDAIAEYQAALRIRPNSAAAHNNLGYALSHLPGELKEAIAEYRQAVRLDPDSPDAHYNLAVALTHLPGGELEARQEFQIVERLRRQ